MARAAVGTLKTMLMVISIFFLSGTPAVLPAAACPLARGWIWQHTSIAPMIGNPAVLTETPIWRVGRRPGQQASRMPACPAEVFEKGLICPRDVVHTLGWGPDPAGAAGAQPFFSGEG